MFKFLELPFILTKRRGGQSSNRFAHIRDEKRHNYLGKIAELSVDCFIEKDLVNVYGLILAGSADLKFELGESDLFDKRLRSKILKYVDIAYGSNAGFNEAIDLASDCLKDVEFVIEKSLLDEYFNQIACETGLYCYGIDETFNALDVGAVKTLIVWENLPVFRYTIQLKNKDEEITYCLQDNLKEKNEKVIIHFDFFLE